MNLRRKIILFVLLFIVSYPINGQDFSPAEREKLNKAEKVADEFIERFRQTLDFDTVWKEFKASDSLCLSKGFYEDLTGNRISSKKLKVNKAFLEKSFVEIMNFIHLKGAYELSVKRANENLDEEDFTPKEILTFQKKLKYLGDKEREPKNIRQLKQLTREANLLSSLYRKYIPSDVMKSPQWKANTDGSIKWDVRADLYIADGGDGNFCTKKGVKVYVVNRHLFYFFIIKENGKMKVQGIGLGD